MQTVQSPQQTRRCRNKGVFWGIASLLASCGFIHAADPVNQTVVSRIPAKVSRYVERIVQKRDLDGNGQLEKVEWQAMTGNPIQIDSDEDSILTTDELLLHVGRYGLARMPVRLLSPSQESKVESAVTLQNPPVESGEASEVPTETTSPRSESDSSEAPRLKVIENEQ